MHIFLKYIILKQINLDIISSMEFFDDIEIKLFILISKLFYNKNIEEELSQFQNNKQNYHKIIKLFGLSIVSNQGYLTNVKEFIHENEKLPLLVIIQALSWFGEMTIDDYYKYFQSKDVLIRRLIIETLSNIGEIPFGFYKNQLHLLPKNYKLIH